MAKNPLEWCQQKPLIFLYLYVCQVLWPETNDLGHRRYRKFSAARCWRAIFGALAEFERNLIKERTLAGLSAARARGRTGGRPPLDTSARHVVAAKKLYRDKSNSIAEICRMLNISRATLYRYLHTGAGNVKES